MIKALKLVKTFNFKSNNDSYLPTSDDLHAEHDDDDDNDLVAEYFTQLAVIAFNLFWE
jgi:hypothetical protein